MPCRFCGGADDDDGHLFWDCPFLPQVEIREHPEFYGLLRAFHGMVGYLCSQG